MPTSGNKNKVKVLFVCMGNICRSPMAEAVFRNKVEEAGLGDRFEITSAGTGDWHVGQLPQRGTREALKRHGIDPDGLVAKHVTQAMLDNADYVVAMDDENLADLQAWRVDRKKITRILDYAPDLGVRDIPDPYYDGRFELVFQLVDKGTDGLLEQIRDRHAF